MSDDSTLLSACQEVMSGAAFECHAALSAAGIDVGLQEVRTSNAPFQCFLQARCSNFLLCVLFPADTDIGLGEV